ncbi:MAG: hypothetical protein LBS07_01870 [Prevotellaceae bacterium]|jgi:hypothetical protein|nr:hypothetical protein [Prevotellaceae bacterium]
MDNFGDIIYLLLLVVGAIVSGLLKKGRKAKPQANPRPVAESFEDEWGEFFGEPEAEAQKQAVEFQPVVVQAKTTAPDQRKIESYETTANNADLRVRNRFAREDNQISMVEDVDETFHIIEEISLETPEDAGIAFVYSEIFARKY